MLIQQGQHLALDRGNPLSKQGVKFVCYLLFGVLTPFLVWYALRLPSFRGDYMPNTAIATSIAAFLTWYTLDKFRFYAKARILSYVVPINLLTFGSAFAIIGLFRAPYSTSLFLSCFAATIVTSYLLTALTRFGSRTEYIAPGGRVTELRERTNRVLADSPDELSRMIDNRELFGSIVGDLHFDHPPEWARLFAKAALHGIPVYHYRQISELVTGQVRIDHLSENVLGSLIPNLPYMALKRGIDVLAVFVALPILLPVFAIIAILIKIDSKGPVFFIQDRVGFRGEVFRLVKFRTMVPREIGNTPEAQREDSMTQSDDDRITRLGRFIRKVRLDELPQAWNVLKGEMSWIGPRPEAMSLSEWYETEIPFYSYRHIVRPGLTGWAQVNQGHVTNLNDVTAKLRYDFYYVKNISHWLDMLIALKTIRVVLRGLGAK